MLKQYLLTARVLTSGGVLICWSSTMSSKRKLRVPNPNQSPNSRFRNTLLNYSENGIEGNCFFFYPRTRSMIIS